MVEEQKQLNNLVSISGGVHTETDTYVVYTIKYQFSLIEVNDFERVIEHYMHNTVDTLIELQQKFPTKKIILMDMLDLSQFNRNYLSQLIPRAYFINKSQKFVLEFVRNHKSLVVVRMSGYGKEAGLFASTAKLLANLTNIGTPRLITKIYFGEDLWEKIPEVVAEIEPTMSLPPTPAST
jgi:hypothetical protein